MQIWVIREDLKPGDLVLDSRGNRGRSAKTEYPKTVGFTYHQTLSDGTLIDTEQRRQFTNLGWTEFLVERKQPEPGQYKIESASDVWARVDKKELRQATKPYDLKIVAPQVRRYYDGLTQEQCFERYTANMREVGKPSTRGPLTIKQKQAAQAMWSEQLKQKQAEAKQKDKHQVLIDIDDADEA